MENLIGKKVKGFRFDHMEFPNVGYGDHMDFAIGKDGIIECYFEENDSYSVDFYGMLNFQYPAELIEQHLID